MSDVFIYNRVKGRKFEEYIALLDVVQKEVDDAADEIAHRAKDALKDHRVQNIAHIEIAKGDIDAYVVLVDSNITNSESAKSNTALSIEFGREAFIDPDTGEEWGAMEGLYILTTAAGLQRKPRGSKSKKTKLAKPVRGANGRWTTREVTD